MHTKAEGIADFHKFPRTHHILDAGGSGVTRDDLVSSWVNSSYMTGNGQEGCREIYHGCDCSGGKGWRCQLGHQHHQRLRSCISKPVLVFSSCLSHCLRAKIISSASHPQWKGLDTWVKNNPGIWDVLTSPDLILFGEWCYARHSVPYSQLPNYLIVFDLFSKTDNK